MFQPEFEAMPRADLEALQVERMRGLLRRVYDNVATYRRMFDDAGFDPDSFSSLADMRHVPFTVKDDLRAGYPYGMFAAPLRDIVRVHSSSGTAPSLR